MKQPFSEYRKYPRYYWHRYLSMSKKDRAFRVMYRECDEARKDFMAILNVTKEGDQVRKIAEANFYVRQNASIDKHQEAIGYE